MYILLLLLLILFLSHRILVWALIGVIVSSRLRRNTPHATWSEQQYLLVSAYSTQLKCLSKTFPGGKCMSAFRMCLLCLVNIQLCMHCQTTTSMSVSCKELVKHKHALHAYYLTMYILLFTII